MLQERLLQIEADAISSKQQPLQADLTNTAQQVNASTELSTLDRNRLTKYAVYTPRDEPRVPLNYDHLLITQQQKREAARIAKKAQPFSMLPTVYTPRTIVEQDDTICFGRYAHYKNAPKSWIVAKLVEDLRHSHSLYYSSATMMKILGEHPLVLAHPELDLTFIVDETVAYMKSRVKPGFEQPEIIQTMNGTGPVVQRGFVVSRNPSPASDDSMAAGPGSSSSNKVKTPLSGISLAKSLNNDTHTPYEQPNFIQTNSEDLEAVCDPTNNSNGYDETCQQTFLVQKVEEEEPVRERKDSAVPRTVRKQCAKATTKQTIVMNKDALRKRSKSDQAHVRWKGAKKDNKNRRHTGDPPRDIMIVGKEDAEEAIASDSESEFDVSDDDKVEEPQPQLVQRRIRYQVPAPAKLPVAGRHLDVPQPIIHEPRQIGLPGHNIARMPFHKPSTSATTAPMKIHNAQLRGQLPCPAEEEPFLRGPDPEAKGVSPRIDVPVHGPQLFPPWGHFKRNLPTEQDLIQVHVHH